MIAGSLCWPLIKTGLTPTPAPKRLEAKISHQEAKSVNKTDELNQAASQSPAPKLSTVSHGWGFVRNKNHSRPGLSQEQEQLLRKYPVIFTIPAKQKDVVLTFDLGYEKGYTPLILDKLKAHGVRATFFVTGAWLRENPELCRRIVAEGHILGNHTMSHPSLPKQSYTQLRNQLLDTEKLIVQNVGLFPGPRFLRPPMGEYSEQMVQWAADLGYSTVFWSIALLDWKPLPGPDVVVRGVMNNLHPGAVILLHGVSKEVTEGLDELLDEMGKEGYKVIPLDKVKV